MSEKATIIPWCAIDVQDPDPMNRPARQFIWIEGACSHSGMRWHREGWGLAHIRLPENGIQGYRAEDVLEIARVADIDPETIKVTHWAPAHITTPYFEGMGVEAEGGT